MDPAGGVLIVDDDESVRRALSELLEEDGFRVVEAENGPAGLRLAREVVPDLVLLDIMMPGMSGVELCRQLRDDAVLAEVPIIMITGMGDHESRIECIEAGADEFLTKPVEESELRARVKTALRLNRFRRLLAQRAQLEWIVDEADDGFLLLDDEGRVSYANGRARRLLGLGDGAPSAEPDKRIGLVDAASVEYCLEPAEVWQRWRLSEGSPSGLHLVRPETEHSRAVYLAVEMLELPPGGDARWVARIRDVSSEVEGYREVRAFHALVNHKLRTPLSTLMGSLGVVVEQGTVPRDRFLEMAMQSAEQLRLGIEDVLGFTCAAACQVVGAGVSPTEVATTVRDVAGALGLKHVQFAVDRGSACGRVPISRQSLYLVIWEILENSKKFHPAGDPCVDVELEESLDKGVTLRATDSGRALSPAELERIWAPYYQAEKWFTGSVEGMGLGLSLVAAIVWGAGGACQARNRRDGPGISVELVFPPGGPLSKES